MIYIFTYSIVYLLISSDLQYYLVTAASSVINEYFQQEPDPGLGRDANCYYEWNKTAVDGWARITIKAQKRY